MSKIDLTALILTHNEEANIGRTLSQLTWVPRIVIVDSLSTDSTIEIVEAFPNTEVVSRPFDNHTNQWNFGLKETGITSEWVLALDADYYLPEELCTEIRTSIAKPQADSYWMHFSYALGGEVIQSGIYPPVQSLYRRSLAEYDYDGHTQRVAVLGDTGDLKKRAIHDDRKSFRRWIHSQLNYAQLEAEKLTQTEKSELNRKDQIRLERKFTPILVFLYCIFVRSGWRDGLRGWQYAYQRLIAEILLQYFLIEQKFSDSQ